MQASTGQSRNNEKDISFIEHMLNYMSERGLTRFVHGNKPRKSTPLQTAAKAGYDARKTGEVLVDYNGAKVPWAPQTRIYTPEGEVRGANLVWDTYPRLDVEQVASESNPKYASSIDRYS